MLSYVCCGTFHIRLIHKVSSITKLFIGSNNEFWILYDEISNQSEVVLFVYLMLLFSSKQSDPLKISWMFVKFKFDILCWIWWTALKGHLLLRNNVEFRNIFYLFFSLLHMCKKPVISFSQIFGSLFYVWMLSGWLAIYTIGWKCFSRSIRLTFINIWFQLSRDFSSICI